MKPDEPEVESKALEEFLLQCRGAEGIAIESLEPGAGLLVDTRNSRYRFIVVDGPKRRMIVKGGAKFPQATPVRLEGTTAGGSAMELGWIRVGLQFQLAHGRRRVRSSPVRAVTIEGPCQPRPSRVE